VGDLGLGAALIGESWWVVTAPPPGIGCIVTAMQRPSGSWLTRCAALFPLAAAASDCATSATSGPRFAGPHTVLDDRGRGVPGASNPPGDGEFAERELQITSRCSASNWPAPAPVLSAASSCSLRVLSSPRASPAAGLLLQAFVERWRRDVLCVTTRPPLAICRVRRDDAAIDQLLHARRGARTSPSSRPHASRSLTW